MDQLPHLMKMTLIKRRDCFIQKAPAIKTSIGFLSNRFDNKNHKDPLGSNKPKLSKAFTRFEALAGPL